MWSEGIFKVLLKAFQAFFRKGKFTIFDNYLMCVRLVFFLSLKSRVNKADPVSTEKSQIGGDSVDTSFKEFATCILRMRVHKFPV